MKEFRENIVGYEQIAVIQKYLGKVYQETILLERDEGKVKTLLLVSDTVRTVQGVTIKTVRQTSSPTSFQQLGMSLGYQPSFEYQLQGDRIVVNLQQQAENLNFHQEATLSVFQIHSGRNELDVRKQLNDFENKKHQKLSELVKERDQIMVEYQEDQDVSREQLYEAVDFTNQEFQQKFLEVEKEYS